MKPFPALLAVLLLAACTGSRLDVQIPGSARSDDLVVYIGIVPAAVARERMAADATTPHQPSTSPSIDLHHLIVALFDPASGVRIDKAEVIVTHQPPRGAPVRRRLNDMRTGDVHSFGAEFEISKSTNHRFEIEIARDARAPERFAFRYDNLH